MRTLNLAMVDAELAKPWHAKASPELSRLYDEKREERRIRHVRLALTLLAIFYSLNIVIDLIVIPDIWRIAVFNRFVITPIVVFCLIRRTFQPSITAEVAERDFSLAILLAAVMHCTCLSLTDYKHNAFGYFSANMAFFIAATPFASFELKRSITSCLALGIVLALTIVQIVPVDIALIASVFCTLAWVPILLIIIGWWLNCERYTVFLQSTKAALQQATIEERNAELLRFSTTDTLTGTLNRRSSDEALTDYAKAWIDGGQSFALFMIDVDFFKRFNDTYGHQEGDACLVRVAQAINAVLAAKGGVLGRFGGEEFIALIRTEESATAVEIGNALLKAVSDLRIRHEGRSDDEAFVTISLGMAFSPQVNARRAEDFVALADRALYRAKASGRGCLCVAPDTSLSMQGQSSSESIIKTEPVLTARSSGSRCDPFMQAS